MNKIITLYKFSRPHTIIGSFVSITTLYLIVVGFPTLEYQWVDYILLVTSALGCNVFITGLNQIVDVDIDKISKPFLPIVSGTLSIKNALQIIWMSLAICFITALFLSPYLLLIMAIIVAIGVAYSVPPIRLKKHHVPAALCITLVRGVIVNLGIGMWLVYHVNGILSVPAVLWPLTIFVVVYSLAIAWLKDLHDVEGDKAFTIKTFAILYSTKLAFVLSNVLVISAFMYSILYCLYIRSLTNNMFLVYAHIALLALYLLHVFTSSYKTQALIQRFYMRFWVFFFAEYVVFAIWSLL